MALVTFDVWPWSVDTPASAQHSPVSSEVSGIALTRRTTLINRNQAQFADIDCARVSLTAIVEEMGELCSPPPANPPFPKVKKRPFHESGNHTSVCAEEFAVALVAIVSWTRQKLSRSSALTLDMLVERFTRVPLG